MKKPYHREIPAVTMVEGEVYTFIKVNNIWVLKGKSGNHEITYHGLILQMTEDIKVTNKKGPFLFKKGDHVTIFKRHGKGTLVKDNGSGIQFTASRLEGKQFTFVLSLAHV